eukprot:9474874-Pyramimonas_sp.AAC.1
MARHAAAPANPTGAIGPLEWRANQYVRRCRKSKFGISGSAQEANPLAQSVVLCLSDCPLLHLG